MSELARLSDAEIRRRMEERTVAQMPHEAVSRPVSVVGGTQCLCGHRRSDHGDGTVHTACSGQLVARFQWGVLEAMCECGEFRAAH